MNARNSNLVNKVEQRDVYHVMDGGSTRFFRTLNNKRNIYYLPQAIIILHKWNKIFLFHYR